MKKFSSIFCFFIIMLTSTVCAEPTIATAKELRAHSGFVRWIQFELYFR